MFFYLNNIQLFSSFKTLFLKLSEPTAFSSSRFYMRLYRKTEGLLQKDVEGTKKAELLINKTQQDIIIYKLLHNILITMSP